MQHWHLGYLLITFSIGLVSLGILFTIYRRIQEKILRDYLFFSCAFTLLVTLNLVSLYVSSLNPQNLSILSVLGYFEAPIAILLLLLTLTRFLHRVCAVSHVRKRNAIVTGLIVLSYICYHVLSTIYYEITYSSDGIHSSDATRIMLVGDDLAIYAGDYFLYAILAIAMIYWLWIAITSYKHVQDHASKRLLKKILLLLGCLLPGIASDLLGIFPIAFFPLLYCGFNTAVTTHYYGKYLSSGKKDMPHETSQEPAIASTSSEEGVFAQHNISPREQELIVLLLQGYRYQDIAETLHISLNTVKAHVRNIYPKLGVKSRYELTSLLKQTPKDPDSTQL